MANPALEKFVAQIGDELVLAQVLISRRGRGHDLRHVADRARPESELRAVAADQLRPIAQFTAAGAFRPLKSAPNLPTGWRTRVPDHEALGTALHQLYPGAVPDWFAAQTNPPPVTHFREFISRQTGMYRITQRLADEECVHVVRAGCHQDFCLKRRLWAVAGLGPDAAGEKSLIPCLEPCALLLEFARQAARLDPAEATPPETFADEKAALRTALPPAAREADFSDANNPRRIRLRLEKLGAPNERRTGAG